jgi:hypothetical protein
MANSYYTTSGILGVKLGGVDTSSSPQFGPLTVVDIYAVSLSNGGFKRAIYVKAGQIVSASTSTTVAFAGTDGTVSISAGGMIALNQVNAAAGDWFWCRTSANAVS